MSQPKYTTRYVNVANLSAYLPGGPENHIDFCRRVADLRELNAYWQERVELEMDRITILILIGAGVLSLKHPGFVGPRGGIVRDALRQMVPLVWEYVPREVLQEWDEVLGTAFT